jgi:hypothetical protein
MKKENNSLQLYLCHVQKDQRQETTLTQRKKLNYVTRADLYTDLPSPPSSFQRSPVGAPPLPPTPPITTAAPPPPPGRLLLNPLAVISDRSFFKRWKSQRSKISRLTYRFSIDFSLLGLAFGFLS